jgi:membrane associated rhomboid family serine protease
MMRLTEAVKHLIIINVIFFVASQLPQLQVFLYGKLPLYYPTNPNFGFWQFISSMFMHGNLMHIFFNMFALASFGPPLEVLWGKNKFLLFYFAAGLGASLLYLFVNYIQFQDVFNQILNQGFSKEEIYGYLSQKQYPTVLENSISKNTIANLFQIFHTSALGASGALYGVLVAFTFKYPNTELALMFIPIPIKAKYFVPGIIALDLILGLKGQSIFGSYGTGIAHFAHIGGALTGYLLMLYFRKTQFNRWD